MSQRPMRQKLLDTSAMGLVQVVDTPLLEGAKDEALKRIRDPADWPALALALQLECAIWTEDQDFFGTGVATWTTATVERAVRRSRLPEHWRCGLRQAHRAGGGTAHAGRRPDRDRATGAQASASCFSSSPWF